MLASFFRLIAAGVLIAAVASGCSTEEGSVPNEAVDDTAVDTTAADTAAPGAALDDLVTAFVANSPGGVDVLLQRDGERRRAVAGVGSEDGDPLAPGQTFRVGSISKTFVAVMVMQLVEEGSVDLDATLDTYLPGTTVGADVTIRQLMEHTSGIPNYTDQPAFFADLLAEPAQTFTRSDILGYVEELPTQSPAEFSYSNTNYILLGQLIEQLDGRELDASLRSRIVEPLGLSSTFFDAAAEDAPEDLVPGWTVAEGTDQLSSYEALVSSAWAAGALVSSVDDLALFLAALSDEQLISATSFEKMSDVGVAGNGLGVFLVNFSAAQTGVGHGGAIPGYSSTMAIDPDTGDMLVILTSDDALVADLLALQVLTEL